MLPPSKTIDSEAYGRFRREAHLAIRLQHPSIVQVFEAGERERQLFYNVVELVSGPTLAEVVAARRLPYKQVARLMEVLALALDHERALGA